MTQPPQQPGTPYVVTKPGGLSGTAHAVHILICFFTCGLWIPGYLLFLAFAPTQRHEVVAPYGTDPQLVAQVQVAAARQTRQSRMSPDERQALRRRNLVVMAIFTVPVVALCLYSILGSR